MRINCLIVKDVILSIELKFVGPKYLASRSTQGPIWGNSHSIQIAGMADMVGLQLAVGQIPHLREQGSLQ